MDSLVFTDTTLGINLSNLTWISGVLPLAPAAKLVYFYPATLRKNLVNLAAVQANPVDNLGHDIPGLADPQDQDSAEVQAQTTSIDLLYITVKREADRVAFTWATLPSRDSTGFHLYRSTRDQRGTAVQLSGQLLTGLVLEKGEFGRVIVYTPSDTTVDSDTIYYYWLIEVKADGSTDEYGPLTVYPLWEYALFLPLVKR